MERTVINIYMTMGGYNRLDHMRSVSDLSRSEVKNMNYYCFLLTKVNIHTDWFGWVCLFNAI